MSRKIFFLCLTLIAVANVSIAEPLDFRKESEKILSQKKSLPKLQPIEKGVVVNIKITEVAKYKPIISGETNLPDGTIMEAAIFGKIRGSHYKGSVCTVSEGKFSFQGFGKSTGIEPGKYVATISSKSAASQNADVKKVIGEQGEKLRGNLIKKSLIGDIAYVYKEKMFFVSDNGSVNNLILKKQMVAQEQKVAEVIGSLKKLEVKGRSMEKLRTSVNLYDAAKCSELRRERQKLAEKLNTNISELDLVEPLTMFLGAASTEMQTCVSCSATRALDSCNRAKEYIKDAEKHLRVK